VGLELAAHKTAHEATTAIEAFHKVGLRAIVKPVKRLSSGQEQREMCLAVPGRVDAIYEEQGTRMGRVDFGGVIKDVCLACLPEIAVGDYTIVHVGFAISKIDEASARETLKTFEELGLLEEELAELQQTDCSVDLGLGARPQ